MELKRDDPRVDIEVFNALRDTGIPANILGYQYLKKALPIVVLNPNAVLKAVEKIYMPIADEWDASYSNIQQGIRRAIRVGWERANLATLEEYFGQAAYNTKMMPKTLEYIAVVAEKVRIRIGLENLKTPSFYEDEIVDDKITRLLYNLSIPNHIKGYQYLREAIFIAIQEDIELAHIAPAVYQKVADTFQTTTMRVMRAMRHGIEVMLEKASLDWMDAFFGPTINLTTCKPTVGEFLATAVENIRLELQYEANNE